MIVEQALGQKIRGHSKVVFMRLQGRRSRVMIQVCWMLLTRLTKVEDQNLDVTRNLVMRNIMELRSLVQIRSFRLLLQLSATTS
jgi:hypothetical protein